MIAEIREGGELIVIAQNSTELYALDKWFETNIDLCTLEFKENHKKLYYDFYKHKRYKMNWFVKFYINYLSKIFK